MSDEIQFEDQSGDRKYFAITPYLIVNGYDATTSGVYTYIKRRCGESADGRFKEGSKVTAKKLKLSAPTYRKIRDLLEKDGRIEFVGWTKGKTHPIKSYKIIDIWEENVLQYKKDKRKGKNKTTSFKDREKIRPLDREKIGSLRRNKLEEEKTVANATLSPLDSLLQAKQRHIQVIGLWARERGLDVPNNEVRDSLIKRNLRPARLLVGYKDTDIVRTIKVLGRTDYLKKFTLETVCKYIDETVAQSRSQGPAVVEYKRVINANGQVVIRPVYAKENG